VYPVALLIKVKLTPEAGPIVEMPLPVCHTEKLRTFHPGLENEAPTHGVSLSGGLAVAGTTSSSDGGGGSELEYVAADQ